MESKYLNRFRSLQKSLENLKLSLGNSKDDLFVLPATVRNYSLTFDLAWKVMKELAVHEFGVLDFATSSPRETLKTAFSVGLIDDDGWMEMLKVRNTLVHDYDGEVANRYFEKIVGEYLNLIDKFVTHARKYYEV